MAGLLILLIGRQGTGKSTSFARIARKLKHPCLILDPGGAQSYKDFPAIHHSQIASKLKTEDLGKIVRLQDTGDRVAEIDSVYGYDPETQRIWKNRAFINGNLFLEDAGAYLDSNLKRQVKSAIKSFKQYGQNLYLSYHSLDEISTDILRLQPHVIILKKTGDKHVFSQIAKTKKLDNYNQLLQSFYKAKFKGLSDKDIFEQLPPDDFLQIALDLRISIEKLKISRSTKYLTEAQAKAIAKELCRFSNGKLKITSKEKEAGKYHEEWVQLR